MTAELIRSSLLYGRTLREMCGDYHPDHKEKNKRWSLTVNDNQIPVFIESKSPAEYPEIRIFPYWDEDSTYMGRNFGYSYGDETQGEDPNILYKRGRADTTLQKIRSVIEIYGTSAEEVFKIRDKLFERFERFRLVEANEFIPIDDWDTDDNVYINANYHSNLGIFRVYDSGDKLKKTSDVANTPGSWDITDDGLLVNPLTHTSNITFWMVINGGLAFYNGDMLQHRGIMKMNIVKSNKGKDEKGPDVPKWEIHVIADYKEVMTFDVEPKINIENNITFP